MLPVPKLDNSSFSEMYAIMRRMSEAQSGQPPDASYQDPGNTLLELFALLFDMQRFYMDSITDEHRIRYARLLGGKPSPLTPALIPVEILPGGQRVLPVGAPVNEGGVPFELCKRFEPADFVKAGAAWARQVRTWCSYIDATPGDGGQIRLDAYLAIYGKVEVFGLSGDNYTRLNEGGGYTLTRDEPGGYAVCTVISGYDEYRIAWYDAAFEDTRGIAVSSAPNLSIPLSVEHLNGDTLELMSESGGIWRAWTRVESFNGSCGCDRHFCVSGGGLRFGNHERGDIPPSGRLLIIRCESSLGRSGNIREIRNQRAVSTAPASGGRDRLEIEMPPVTRKAVTAGDYISLLISCADLKLEQVNAAAGSGPDNNSVAMRLYVKPASGEPFPVLNDEYVKDILAYLEPYRIITTKLVVHSAEYVPFSLNLSAVFDSRYNAEQGFEMVLSALRQKFPYKGFTGGVRRAFGERITYGEIYACIREAPCITIIKTLKVLDSGGAELHYLQLGPGQLAYLDEVTFGETEFRHG